MSASIILGKDVSDIASLQTYRPGRWSPVDLLIDGQKFGTLKIKSVLILLNDHECIRLSKG